MYQIFFHQLWRVFSSLNTEKTIRLLIAMILRSIVRTPEIHVTDVKLIQVMIFSKKICAFIDTGQFRTLELTNEFSIHRHQNIVQCLKTGHIFEHYDFSR